MPLYRRRRATRKPLMKKRRYANRKRLANKRHNQKYGAVRIVRKCVEQNVYNTGVAGTPAASGAVVVVGTAYQTPAFAGSTYYNVPFSIETSLDDLINYTEFTSIADKYKINWVKVKVFCTSNTASSGSTAQLPSLLWTVDEDDAVVPTGSTAGLNALRERMDVKIRQFKQDGSPLTIFYRPKMAREVYGAAGAAQGAEITPARFMNCTYSSVPHYGVKGYIQDMNLAATPTAYTQVKFDISMSITLKDIQ